MSAGQPEIPAQTITMSSDQLNAEMADRLEKAVVGFRVHRSAYYVRLQHLPCLQVLITSAETTLLELVLRAMGHDCPGSPE